MRFTTTSLLLLSLTFSAQAQAYLDPGTGSMIISAIVGVIATLALALKTYWYKLTGLLRKKSSGSDPESGAVGSVETDKSRD